MIKIIPITFLVLILSFFSEVFSEKDELKKTYIRKNKFFVVIIIIACTVFAMLRTGYNDTKTYLEIYDFLTSPNIDLSVLKNNIRDSPGFLLLNQIIKHFKFSDNAYLLVYAFLTYAIYIWFIRKYSTDFLMSMFLFICLDFTFPLAAIRQTIAVAFCLVAVDKYLNNKWFWFIFWLIIAELFHPYAFLYLMVPLFMFVPWNDNKVFYWLAFFIAVGIFLKPFMGIILSFISNFGKKYEESEMMGAGVNPLRVIITFVPLILSFILRKKIISPEYEVDKKEGLLLNLTYLNGELMFVALFGTANYFARLANYFNIFPIIMLPRLFNMVSDRWRFLLKTVAVMCYLFFFYYSNVIAGWNPFDIEFVRIPLREFHWFN